MKGGGVGYNVSQGFPNAAVSYEREIESVDFENAPNRG